MVLYGLYLTRKKNLKHYLEKLLCVLNANLDCHKFKTKCLNKVKKTTLNTYSWFYVIWHTILEEWILFWIRKHLESSAIIHSFNCADNIKRSFRWRHQVVFSFVMNDGEDKSKESAAPLFCTSFFCLLYVKG